MPRAPSPTIDPDPVATAPRTVNGTGCTPVPGAPTPWHFSLQFPGGRDGKLVACLWSGGVGQARCGWSPLANRSLRDSRRRLPTLAPRRRDRFSVLANICISWSYRRLGPFRGPCRGGVGPLLLLLFSL